MAYHYYHDESKQVLEVRKDSDTDPFEQYVYHPYYVDAAAVRWWDKDDSGGFGTMATPDDDELQFYVHDANFNVTSVIEDDGTVLERYRYTPYGQVTYLNPTTFAALATQVSAIENPILYTGRWLDAETGLYFYNARYYHPQLGRFINRDPSVYIDGMNMYAYVGGNPLSATDPYGLESTHPPGWDTSKHACWNCHAPEVKLYQENPWTEEDFANWRTAPRNWYNYQGSAWDLWGSWWRESHRHIRRTVTINGDTPFTLELRKSSWFNNFRDTTIRNNLRYYCCDMDDPASLELLGKTTGGPVLLEGRCTRSYGKLDMWREPMDVFNMFVGYAFYSGEVADTFLGSFDGTFKLENVDCRTRTAKITFKLTNTTGWQSATKIWSDDVGAVYRQNIRWSEHYEWED